MYKNTALIQKDFVEILELIRLSFLSCPHYYVTDDVRVRVLLRNHIYDSPPMSMYVVKKKKNKEYIIHKLYFL